MAQPNEHRDRLIDLLLREQLGSEQPPDLEERILARACPSRMRRRPWIVAAALAIAASVVLTVGLRLTIGPNMTGVAPVSPGSPESRDDPDVPAPVLAPRDSLRPLNRVAATAPPLRLTSPNVHIPIRNTTPFRIPDAAPIPPGRVRIPDFSVRLPRSVTPFTIKSKKRSPS